MALSWEMLARSGLLPGATGGPGREEALARLATAARDGRSYPGYPAESRGLFADQRVVQAQAEPLARLLHLLACLRDAAGKTEAETARANLPGLIEELAASRPASSPDAAAQTPLQALLALVEHDDGDYPPPAAPGAPDPAQRFLDLAAAIAREPERDPAARDWQRAWNNAAQRVRRAASTAGVQVPPSFQLEALLARLLRRGPGRFLPLDPVRMDALAWSRAAAEVFNADPSADAVPAWLLAAALHRLGLRGPVLERAMAFRPGLAAPIAMGEALVKGVIAPAMAMTAPGFSVVILADGAAAPPAATPALSGGFVPSDSGTLSTAPPQPLLLLEETRASDYVGLVGWLREQGQIAEVRDEQ